ncbi:MAG TPA: hypothetical protein VFW25_00940 [Silvibacterium sp.]|nr:hypothetical protein [Silvibacterium sp.]
MKLNYFAALVLCGTLCIAAAQQQTTPANPNAKVIYSRSDDQTSAQTVTPPPAKVTDKVTDAQRSAIVFTAYDLDLHLVPRDHTLSARAQLQIRNDAAQPLTIIPLQLSSSLNFEGVSLNGQRLPFTRFILNSDTDHTGLLHEAAIKLSTPLAPKASVNLVVVYSGIIDTDARRLVQLGTPDDAALYSDWDRISEDFTGIRGFGNVVWYPVASIPALFGDGDKVFAEIGKQKLRDEDATVSLRLTIEYYLAPPTAIVLDGNSVSVPKPTVTPTQQYPGIITVALSPTKIGFGAPSLFLTSAALSESNGLRIYARPEDQANAPGLMTAATQVQPVITQWLGAKPKSPLTIIDLPEPQDLPWQHGPLLVTGIYDQPAATNNTMMADALAHAYFQSPREWLSEGVPNFLETLWIEHTSDRTHALEQLESQRSALALAEPATPGNAPGEDLLHASAPIYYRAKATFVLWMLRDLVGEKALAAALQTYDSVADTTPDYFQKLVERASGPAAKKDLQWFFDNWVYNDRGLPDLSIAAFHSTPTSHQGLYLAAIDIMNDGFAETEVPVTVRSGSNTLTERVLLPGKTRTVHRMLVQGQPDQVIVNDGTVPEVQADIHQRNITEQ